MLVRKFGLNGWKVSLIGWLLLLCCIMGKVMWMCSIMCWWVV